MSFARNLLLAASTSSWLREHATRAGWVRRSVSRFMPGEQLDDALDATRAELRYGISTVLTRLGENVASAAEAEQVTEHYLGALDRIASAGLAAQLSIKPTQLGLDVDGAACLENTRRLVAKAQALGNFVWIDMESSPYVDATLDLFRRLREASPAVGVCVQAYLHRTAADIETLIPLGSAVRIVKGAYLEPPTIAYPRKADVDENFFRLCARLLSEDALKAGTRLHVGTHDPVLVDRVAAFVSEHHVPDARCEYVMLYGIQRALQLRLAASGRPMRVLVAYGDYWFPWYMRRLAERPANVGFLIRNLLAR